MKKFASLLCLALFAMTLIVGCGDKKAETPEVPEVETPPVPAVPAVPAPE